MTTIKNILILAMVFITGMSWLFAFGYLFNTTIDLSQLFGAFAFALCTSVALGILIDILK